MGERAVPPRIHSGQVEVSFPNRRRWILPAVLGVAVAGLCVCLWAFCRRWCR